MSVTLHFASLELLLHHDWDLILTKFGAEQLRVVHVGALNVALGRSLPLLAHHLVGDVSVHWLVALGVLRGVTVASSVHLAHLVLGLLLAVLLVELELLDPVVLGNTLRFAGGQEIILPHYNHLVAAGHAALEAFRGVGGRGGCLLAEHGVGSLLVLPLLLRPVVLGEVLPLLVLEPLFTPTAQVVGPLLIESLLGLPERFAVEGLDGLRGEDPFVVLPLHLLLVNVAGLGLPLILQLPRVDGASPGSLAVPGRDDLVVTGRSSTRLLRDARLSGALLGFLLEGSILGEDLVRIHAADVASAVLQDVVGSDARGTLGPNGWPLVAVRAAWE